MSTLAPAACRHNTGGRCGIVSDMPSGSETGTIISAIAVAIGAPWFKGWLDDRHARKADRKARRAAEPFVEDQRIARLFDEASELRQQWREEVHELRNQLAAARAEGYTLSQRVTRLELELSEWKSGLQGVPGVWVAVPASIWQTIRNGEIPPLPSSLPGEHFHDSTA